VSDGLSAGPHFVTQLRVPRQRTAGANAELQAKQLEDRRGERLLEILGEVRDHSGPDYQSKI
jgi:succinate dehydrogenase/fumarate reductase-like Fe-S protein